MFIQYSSLGLPPVGMPYAAGRTGSGRLVQLPMSTHKAFNGQCSMLWTGSRLMRLLAWLRQLVHAAPGPHTRQCSVVQLRDAALSQPHVMGDLFERLQVEVVAQHNPAL